MSDTDSMARDVRAGYIAWCRGEVPAKMAGADFDRMIARIKAEAWDEGCGAGLDYALDVEGHSKMGTPFPKVPANPYREEQGNG